MFCSSGNIIIISKIRHNRSHLVACSWTCTDKQCVLIEYRVQFWHDSYLWNLFLAEWHDYYKIYIKRNIYINTHTLFLCQRKKLWLRRNLTKNSLFLGTSAVGIKFSFQKSTWKIIYPHGNLFLHWHQEPALPYFRIDAQPTWTVIVPLEPIWEYIYTEILYTSAGSKSQIINNNLKISRTILQEE